MSLDLQLAMEQFHQLILNASSYITKIETFSFKIVNCSIQSILKCLGTAAKMLADQSTPMIKKLYILRFVKDTMILASLAFYQCVLIKILPWIIKAFSTLENSPQEKRMEMMGTFLKGNQQLINNQAAVCKSILQLMEQITKWMSTNIKDHPYSKITFKSAFKMLIQRYPRIQNIKVTDLSYFKADDPNRYQAYYLERESGEAEGQRFSQYVSYIIEQAERGQTLPDLQAFIETGDHHVINCVVQEIEAILQDVRVNNVLNMLILVEQIHRLIAIGDVEAVNLAKNTLLERVLMVVLILNKHKQQFTTAEMQVKNILSMIRFWNQKCQALLLPVEAFREAYKLLQRQGIDLNRIQQGRIIYEPRIGFTIAINKQKLNQIDCNESVAIKRIRACKYIPVFESIPYNRQKLKSEEANHSQTKNHGGSNRSGSRPSQVSSNSFYNKQQFLQAFSKFPQKLNIPKNSSEVNQIHLQHSNLSDKFNQVNNLKELAPKVINASQSSQKPLMISFKKTERQEEQNSPQVVFTDSFTSNQKNSPIKRTTSNNLIETVHQPRQLPSKQSIKHSRSQKFGLSNNSSENNQNNRDHHASNNGSRANEKEAVYKYNDYMLPQKQPSQNFISKQSSKHGSRLKKEKCSSLSRSNNNMAFKSHSRQRLGVSPISKISNSKSIHIIQFKQAENQMEQTYKPHTLSKNIPSVEQIKVEKTITKPKFGFKVQQDSIDTISEPQGPNNQLQSYSITQTYTISSINQKAQEPVIHQGTIPDNFIDLLKVKAEKVKVNGFDSKVKELQKQIQRMKQKKQQTAKIVMEQQKVIQKLKSEMPLPKQKLQEQNKMLKRAMQPTKSQQISAPYRLNHPLQSKAVMKHISVSPLREDLKKQILYSKCRLVKNQYLQIGFDAKNNQISLHFTFLTFVQEFTIKIEQNSMILAEQLDAKIYKLPEGKQIKFKAIINGHRLFNGQFQLATLMVGLQLAGKKREKLQLSIPFHLYSLIQFISSKATQKFNRITDWHFCCNGLLTNPHYLADFFPNIKNYGGIFYLRGELELNSADIRIIIDNDKFAIEFEGVNEAFDLILVRCVMAFIERANS